MLQNALSGLSELAGAQTLALIVFAMAAAAVMALALDLLRRARQGHRVHAPTNDISRPTFLFEGRNLVDATPTARRLVRSGPAAGDDWERVSAALALRFPDLARFSDPPDRPSELSAGGEDGARLEIDCWETMTRLSILTGAGDLPEVHPATISAMEDEIEMLRLVSDEAPTLAWKEDRDGHVTWANRAYLELADQVASGTSLGGPTWPPARLFRETADAAEDGEAESSARIPLDIPGSKVRRWYDVTRRPRRTDAIIHAVDVSAVVAAEEQRRDFMQTITKTFANLSIGLAIFDRQRRLVIFNPALMDLTSLPVGFLASHPHIRAFLDRLRDHNMIPEPANYHTWREQMAALEVAAEQGSYKENWTLPTGQTYRVSGRPHPDGAIAFTFEDITAEISLTRGFRAELDIAQGVVDALDEAIAVFSPAGTMWMSNSAYAAMWGQSADGLEEIGLTDQIALWRSASAPSEIWGGVKALAGALAEKKVLTAEVRRRDGRLLACRFVPLPGGALLAGFLHRAAQLPEPAPAERPAGAAAPDLDAAVGGG